MDYLQIIISICLISLTTIFVVTGVWITLILNDLRQVIKKTTSILDNARSISESVARPVNSFSEFLMGFRNGLNVFNKFFKE